MKHLILVFLAFILASPSYAFKIQVVTENNPPYQEVINSEIQGLATEIIKEVLHEAGIEYEINLYPWARAYTIAQLEENVLIYSIARTVNREELFNWVDEIIPISVFMYKRKGSEVKATNLEEAKAYQVGVINKGFRYEFFINNGFVEGQNLSSLSRDELNMQKLLAGRIDLLPFDEIGLKTKARLFDLDTDKFEKVFKLDGMSTSLYAACSQKTSPHIIQLLKAAFQRVRGDGRYQAIIDKYLNDM
jgi:polar amino acid transport system substrate-binding protein